MTNRLLLTLCLLWGGLFLPGHLAAQDADAPAEPEIEAAAEEGGQAVTTSSMVDKLQTGGITIIFLLLLSIGGLSFAIERFSNLRRSVIIPEGLVEKVEKAWKAENYPQVERLCQEQPSTAGQILKTYLEYRHYPPSELHPIGSDIASRDLKRHLQRAYPLAVVGAVAPLLGLMGTVFGMIESFEMVAVAGSLGDASILADGISKALVTTATGLVVAVPFLLLYHFFKTRTTLFAVDLEEAINEFTKRMFMEPAAASAATEAVAESPNPQSPEPSTGHES